MTSVRIAGLTMAAWLLSTPTWAQQAPLAAELRPEPPPASATGAVALDVASLDAAPLGDDELRTLNAREGVVVIVASDQLLHAVNSGNSINAGSVASGDISIGANAFSGFDGIGNFVMNTGHNNNLQGAVTVNVATGAPTP